MLRGKINSAKYKIGDWFSQIFGGYSDEVPKEGDEAGVAQWVKNLYKESSLWRAKSLQGRLGYSDPQKFWEMCRKLEMGAHWDVWGHRNLGEVDKEWHQELVDEEIGNQIRVKKSHMTANWHDIVIMPNLANVNEILDQERKTTHWGDTIQQAVMQGLTEGTSIIKSVFDKSEDERGLSCEEVCDNQSIFPTPFSVGFRKVEGCWYVIHATMKTTQQILDDYPGIERSELTQVTKELAKNVSSKTDYDAQGMILTQIVPHMELWCDDATLIPVKADAEEISLEHEAILIGHAPEVAADQDHGAHVSSHVGFLDSLQSGPRDETTQEFYSAVVELIILHIGEHQKAAEAKVKEGIPIKKTPKYPNGRLIVLVGDSLVARDSPSPWNFDWRRCFNKWEPERLKGHFWGRGVAEILYNSNFAKDSALSRHADSGLTTSMPKVYFNIADKENVEEQKFTNDPTHPLFLTQAPTIRQGSPAIENMEIYKIFDANTSKALGVSDISYGEVPSAQASGKLVEILRQANSIVITGEGNLRLSDLIEDVIETRLMMWRQYYTEPRYYFINGTPRAINVSKLLTTYKTRTETGEELEKEIPEFQVKVRPNSNFPQQFENEFAFLLQLMETPSPDGAPLVPREAILDVLAQRYPQFGRDGEYYRLSEATARGLQVLQQEQAKAEAEQKTLKGIARQYQKSGTREIMNPAQNTSSTIKG